MQFTVVLGFVQLFNQCLFGRPISPVTLNAGTITCISDAFFEWDKIKKTLLFNALCNCSEIKWRINCDSAPDEPEFPTQF